MLKAVVLEDSFGLCATLEAEMDPALVVEPIAASGARSSRTRSARSCFSISATAAFPIPSSASRRGAIRSSPSPGLWPEEPASSPPAILSAEYGLEMGRDRRGEYGAQGCGARDVGDGATDRRSSTTRAKTSSYATENRCPHKKDMVLARGNARLATRGTQGRLSHSTSGPSPWQRARDSPIRLSACRPSPSENREGTGCSSSFLTSARVGCRERVMSAQLTLDVTPSLVDLLLEEQQSLTAVDEFSQAHEKDRSVQGTLGDVDPPSRARGRASSTPFGSTSIFAAAARHA